MNKKLLQKVAIASVAALIAMPNLVIPTNSYASNVIGPAGGSPVSEGNRTIAGDNSDVAILDGDYTGTVYKDPVDKQMNRGNTEAEIKKHIKKNKNPNNPAKYYNDLGKGKYFRDSKSGHIFTADGGYNWYESNAKGVSITRNQYGGGEISFKNVKTEGLDLQLYKDVELAVFILNNPGVMITRSAYCSYVAQKYQVYKDTASDGTPAWVDRNKDNWEYNIYGDKVYPQLVQIEHPLNWMRQYRQGTDIRFGGWSIKSDNFTIDSMPLYVPNQDPNYKFDYNNLEKSRTYTSNFGVTSTITDREVLANEIANKGDTVDENYGENGILEQLKHSILGW